MKQRNAFTMTEMLVLIPVMALVGALLLASVNDAQDKLKATACLNNMRQWGLGLALYANDYNDYWPYEGIFGGQIDSGANLNAWYNVIPPYIHQSRLVDLYSANKPPTALTKGIFSCPSATNVTVSPTSASPYFMYAINARMSLNGSAQCRRSQLTSPSNTIVFAEGSEDNIPGTDGKYCPARHFGGGNFVMGDGHAEWVNLQDYCREGSPGCTNTISETDSSGLGDWAKSTKYHWYPFRSQQT
jgi:prepilin-type processing-associated H-X9-DG protein